MISRSCGVRIEWYHIKIMSSLHHATHLKTSDFSLSFWSERIYISSGRTEQYWQTQAYFLALVEKYCFTQGPVFTPNCEISIQWNKLWNFESTNFVLYDGRARHSRGGTLFGLILKCIYPLGSLDVARPWRFHVFFVTQGNRCNALELFICSKGHPPFHLRPWQGRMISSLWSTVGKLHMWR